MNSGLHVLSDDKAQLLAVTTFNYFPNRYIHPSWVQRLENSAVISKLLRRSRSEDNLASYLLERFDLKGRFWFEFDTPLRRLLLEDREAILRVVMYAGAVLNSRHAHRAAYGRGMRWLQQGFGDRLFEFALHDAPLVFDMTALPRVVPPRPGDDVQAHLAASGLWCLGRALDGEPRVIVDRLYLKMSAAEYPFLSAPPSTFDKAVCRAVIEELLQRRFPF